MTTGAISTAHEWVDSRTTTQSRSGAVTVTTTAQGLPVAIRLADSAMGLGADALASQVLTLCEQGRTAASVRLRELMAANGVDDEVLATMSLATTDDLARAQAVDDEQACAPRTWFR